MTIHALASEIPGFQPSDSNTNEFALTDSFARAASLTQSSSSYSFVNGLPNLTDFWFHGFCFGRTASKYVVFVNNSGTEMFRMNSTSTSYTFQSFATGSWVTMGTITLNGDSVQEVDIHLNAAASGTLDVYIAGTSRLALTGNYAALASIAEIRCYGGSSSGIASTYTYGVAVASEPTIGWRVATYYPSGTGSDTGFTGSYTSIDETQHSDADFINATSAGLISTFVTTGPALTGYTVRAVGVYARAKRGAAGPQKLRLALRSSGTTYPSSADISLTVAYTSPGYIWETDPATSAAFLSTGVASLQPGVKSIA